MDKDWKIISLINENLQKWKKLSKPNYPIHPIRSSLEYSSRSSLKFRKLFHLQLLSIYSILGHLTLLRWSWIYSVYVALSFNKTSHYPWNLPPRNTLSWNSQCMHWNHAYLSNNCMCNLLPPSIFNNKAKIVKQFYCHLHAPIAGNLSLINFHIQVKNSTYRLI